VLLGFLVLFAFFDLISELGDLGKARTTCARYSRSCCSMRPRTPTSSSDVVLIGTLYVLAHLASNSEYTVMRGSGFPRRAAAALLKIGAAFVVLTFIIGEWISPAAEEALRRPRCARFPR